MPYGLIAQQVEQRTETSCGAGSIPAETTIFLTINCLYGDFRHATVFLDFSRIRQSSRPLELIKLKPCTESMSLYKTGNGGSFHTFGSFKVEDIIEKCDASTRIGFAVVLFI